MLKNISISKKKVPRGVKCAGNIIRESIVGYEMYGLALTLVQPRSGLPWTYISRPRMSTVRGRFVACLVCCVWI